MVQKQVKTYPQNVNIGLYDFALKSLSSLIGD